MTERPDHDDVDEAIYIRIDGVGPNDVDHGAMAEVANSVYHALSGDHDLTGVVPVFSPEYDPRLGSGLDPDRFAAVVSVEYAAKSADMGGGSSAFGLDAEHADALAEAIREGVEAAVDAETADDRLHVVANGLIRSLHNGRAHALRDGEADD